MNPLCSLRTLIRYGTPVEHDIIFERRNDVRDGQYGLAMMDTRSHHFITKRSQYFYNDTIIALTNIL